MDENDKGYFTSEDEDDENSLNKISPNETMKETIPSGMCFISHVLFPALDQSDLDHFHIIYIFYPFDRRY